MDSVTQVVLGASVAAICVPKQHRRKAAVIGAGLGTLPDLDVFIDYGDAVANFTLHRGFSHSLFILIPFASLLWLLLKRIFTPVREYPKHWFWAITLTLVTHPLLDAHTAYGTQLFWPLDVTPTMWSTLFIIDPLYTLPLLIAAIACWTIPSKAITSRLLSFGLIVSCVYLGWSWLAKYQVSQQVYTSLNKAPHEVKFFSTPTPFNTLMWRVVVLDEETYLEGYYHYMHPGPIAFNRHKLQRELFQQNGDMADVKQLQWFANGFNRADIINDGLIISDLRMGFEDNYVFRHKVAEQDGQGWQTVTSSRLASQLDSEDLQLFWQMFNNAH